MRKKAGLRPKNSIVTYEDFKLAVAAHLTLKNKMKDMAAQTEKYRAIIDAYLVSQAKLSDGSKEVVVEFPNQKMVVRNSVVTKVSFTDDALDLLREWELEEAIEQTEFINESTVEQLYLNEEITPEQIAQITETKESGRLTINPYKEEDES